MTSRWSTLWSKMMTMRGKISALWWDWSKDCKAKWVISLKTNLNDQQNASGLKITKNQLETNNTLCQNEKSASVFAFKTMVSARLQIANTSILTVVTSLEDDEKRLLFSKITKAEINCQDDEWEYAMISPRDTAEGIRATIHTINKRPQAINKINNQDETCAQTKTSLLKRAGWCGIQAFARIHAANGSMGPTTKPPANAMLWETKNIASFFSRVKDANFPIKHKQIFLPWTTPHWETPDHKGSCYQRRVSDKQKTIRGTSVLGIVNTRGPHTMTLFMTPLWWLKIVQAKLLRQIKI